MSRSKKPIFQNGLEIDSQAILSIFVYPLTLFQATVAELKAAIYDKKQKWKPERQRLTLPLESKQTRTIVLENDNTLASYGLSNGSQIIFKDLGPQVRFPQPFKSNLFRLDIPQCSFGNILAHCWCIPFSTSFQVSIGGASENSFLSNGRVLIFRGPIPHHPIQTLALAFWSFHYTKRIMETFFVHR